MAQWLDSSSSTTTIAAPGPTSTAPEQTPTAPAPASATSTSTYRPIKASPTRTPGVYNPEVTQATITTTICVSGWTATIRPPTSYTNTLKLTQMAQYRETGSPHAYEEDHLIPLELGGAPGDPRNLWPEPHPRSGVVDGIETHLKTLVCHGQLTLAAARLQISKLKHTVG